MPGVGIHPPGVIIPHSPVAIGRRLLLLLLAHGSGGDKLAEALRVREGVPGPHGPRTPPHGGMPPEDEVSGARPGRADLLLESHFVAQGGSRVDVVEALGHHGQKENDHGEDDGEPEGRGAHDSPTDPHILVVDQVRVEDKGEDDVEKNAAPDHRVVEARPVVRVQRTLKT